MTAAPASENPRYEANENAPWLLSLGLGLQFSLIASATLLITPVIVANASGRGESYLVWMVFASLLVVGAATLVQVRRLGPIGAATVLPFFTAAFSIPFCITALVDGGPATLTTLILAAAIVQLIISRWLFILRRIVTPTVGGTVMMILSITLASVVFGLLDEASLEEPTAAPLTALTTLVIVGALTLRGSPVWRLWAPVIGIVAGCGVAAAFGIYDAQRVIDAPWVGLPSEWPGLALDFSTAFWTLLPAFLFLGVINSIQANGEAIALQRVARRDDRAVDFREVQGAIAGSGAANVFAGIAGAVPTAINPGIVSFTQITGVASRRVGYIIGTIFILLAFLPKVAGLLSTIPGPVMTGYLILVTGTLMVTGMQTVVHTERNKEKVVAAGVAFWIGAAFQFKLFTLPSLGAVWQGLLQSGITTGGIAVIAMILFPGAFPPPPHAFRVAAGQQRPAGAQRFRRKVRGEQGMGLGDEGPVERGRGRDALDASPAGLEPRPGCRGGRRGRRRGGRRLIVLAASEGPVAEMEFIGGDSEEGNLEDRIRQLQQHDEETPMENEISLRLLRRYASSVRHQQFHGTDIITVSVGPPGTR